MILTDTHTHLYYDNIDVSDQLNRAIKNGIYRLFMPNIDSSTIADLLNISNKYPSNCFPMLGLHPASVNNNYKLELDKIKQALKVSSKVCAIGEIGLDYFHSTKFIKEQYDAFIEQIHWAQEYNLPIVIHMRNSYKDFITIVKKHLLKSTKAVVHCFTGSEQEAQELISLGFFLGIGGILTYKNSNLREVLKTIPIENIVLETDSPFLAPVPFRGKKNESSFLIYIAMEVAKVYNISIEEVAIITTQNSKRLFSI